MSLSPLRRAVRSRLLAGEEITVEALRCAARVTRRGTRMYLTCLVSQGVLVKQSDRYVPGPQVDAWTREIPRTRPGGTSRRYRAMRARRERQEGRSDGLTLPA